MAACVREEEDREQIKNTLITEISRRDLFSNSISADAIKRIRRGNRMKNAYRGDSLGRC